MGLLSTDAKTELATGRVHLAFFAELEFRSGTERYWSGIAPLSWDSETWTGTGHLGGVGPMESSEDFRANGLQLSVAGLPGSAFADYDALTASDYKGRRARFVIAIMDSTFQTVIHAIERHFFIDTLDYALDPDLGGVISVGLEVETRRASRVKVRRYTPQDQEKEHPGDKAFEFVPYINSGVDVKWGKGGSFFPPVTA
jgi:hypothetical protein